MVGAHEGRIDSPLLTVEKWATALKTAHFGDLEVATDILGYQASVMAASARKNEHLTNGKVVKPLHIIAPGSVRSKTHLQAFTNDLLHRLKTADYSPEFVDFPQKPDESIRYIILEDGAQP